MYAVSLVVRKGVTLETSFPPLSAHGECGPGPSGLHSRLVDNLCFSLVPRSKYVVSQWPHHLTISFQDLPLPSSFLDPNPRSSCIILEFHFIAVIQVISFSPCPLLRFFFLYKLLSPLSHLRRVRLVFGPLRDRKTVGFHIIDRGTQPNGGFFSLFYLIPIFKKNPRKILKFETLKF